MNNLRLTIIMFILAAALAPAVFVGFGGGSKASSQPVAPPPVIEPGMFAPAGLKQAPWEGMTKPRANPADQPAPPASASGAGAEPSVVVELFTSEGCSSCPPADKLLSEIAAPGPASARLVCIAYHVDYWDHLGWKDPFADAAHTELQRSYARALKDSGVYTPQAVVNGRTGFVGSDRERMTGAIDRAMAAPAVARVSAVLERPFKAGETVRVAVRISPVGDHKLPKGLRVVGAITEDGLVSKVARGENGGRELRHDAVCRAKSETKADAEGRATLEMKIPAGIKPERARVAVWAHNPEDGAIVAAAYAAAGVK